MVKSVGTKKQARNVLPEHRLIGNNGFTSAQTDNNRQLTESDAAANQINALSKSSEDQDMDSSSEENESSSA